MENMSRIGSQLWLRIHRIEQQQTIAIIVGRTTIFHCNLAWNLTILWWQSDNLPRWSTRRAISKHPSGHVNHVNAHPASNTRLYCNQLHSEGWCRWPPTSFSCRSSNCASTQCSIRRCSHHWTAEDCNSTNDCINNKTTIHIGRFRRSQLSIEHWAALKQIISSLIQTEWITTTIQWRMALHRDVLMPYQEAFCILWSRSMNPVHAFHKETEREGDWRYRLSSASRPHQSNGFDRGIPNLNRDHGEHEQSWIPVMT